MMTNLQILTTAHNMLGDGQGGEWHDNPEYTRAVVEFVSESIPVSEEILDKGGSDRDPFVLGMIFAANLIEKD